MQSNVCLYIKRRPHVRIPGVDGPGDGAGLLLCRGFLLTWLLVGQEPACRKAPVAQWIKRWPTDLAVPGSSPAWGGNLSNRKRGSMEHILSLLP